MRSACSTERPGGRRTSLQAGLNEAAGQDWRYGDCSPEERSGSSSPELMKGFRDAMTAKEATIEDRISDGGCRRQIGVPLVTSLAASTLLRWAKSWRVRRPW